jgi:predicted dinucleotide-binding enzyme
MRIAVIGAGRIGGTIGGKWEEAGHEVVYGLRDTTKRKGSKPIAEALEAANTVLLAIPGKEVVEFVRRHAKGLDGKTLIDATNNFGGPAMNSWQAISSAVPKARLYRAFNSYGWDVFEKPTLGGETPDLFYAGPDDEVEGLITDVGLRPVRVGGTDAVDAVDGVLRLWYTLAQSRGRRIGFKLLSD